MNTPALIQSYFAKLGLAPEIAQLYLALHTHGPQTISQLARSASIERTRIYRLTEQLASSSLIEVETHHKRVIYKAAPITNLRILIDQREQELRDLHTNLATVEHALTTTSNLISPATRIQAYEKPEGIKQMLWNQTKAHTEVITILHETMQLSTSTTFFERWVAASNARNLHFRSVLGQTFLAGLTSWNQAHTNEHLQHWQARLIDPTILPVTHNTMVYDNVVAHYNWKDGQLFGLEIYNQDIADTQRHLFELLWAQGSSLPAQTT